MEKTISELLSKEEIDDVYRRYMSGEDKKTLLNEYGISKFSQQFPRVLPPIELRGICSQCKNKLVVFRKARTSKNYTCINCKHDVNMKEYEDRRVLSSFNEDEWKQSVLYNEINLRDKFFLSAFMSAQIGVPGYLRANPNLSAKYINSQVCSTISKGKEIISELAIREIISIDTKSNFNISYLENSCNPDEVCELDIYWNDAILNQNLDIYIREELLEAIKIDVKNEFIKKENRACVINIIKELEIDELIQCIEKSLASVQIEEELPRAALQKATVIID